MHNTTAAALLNSVPLMPQLAICHNTQPLTPTSQLVLLRYYLSETILLFLDFLDVFKTFIQENLLLIHYLLHSKPAVSREQCIWPSYCSCDFEKC